MIRPRFVPVWQDTAIPPPPTPSISVVGADGVVGTSITIPAHLTGDLIVIVARAVTATIPTAPAGWTTPTGAARADGTTATRIAYRVAVNNATVSGTWTGADRLTVAVYRGASALANVVATTGTSVSTGGVLGIETPALTLAAPAWVVGFLGVSEAVVVPPRPDAVDRYALQGSRRRSWADSNGPVSAWPARTVTPSLGAGRWTAIYAELVAA